MANQIGWHIPNKLLYLKGEGIIDIDAIRVIIEQIPAYFEQSDEPLVHLILDARDSESAGKSLKERVEVIRPVFQHPQCGWIIMIGLTNPIASFLASTAAQVLKTRFRSFKTLEEGTAFLINVAPTIDHIPAFEGEPE